MHQHLNSSHSKETAPVLQILSFLNGDFINADDTRSRGYAMIIGFLLGLKQTISGILPSMYADLMGMLRQILPDIKPIKILFGGLVLPFLIFMYFLHGNITGSIIPVLASNKELWSMIYWCFLLMTTISYLILIFTEAHNFDNTLDRLHVEEGVKNDPYLGTKSPRCNECKIPNIIRSIHCRFCNAHVAKYQKHSSSVNKCIGAGNTVPYTSYLFFLTWLFVISAITIILPKNEEFKPGKAKKFWFNILFILYMSLAFSRFIEFLKFVTYICYNITAYEAANYFNLAYLWKSPRKEFFNPFDKTVLRNLKEEIYTTINYQEPRRSDLLSSLEEVHLKESHEDPEDNEGKRLEDERKSIVNWRQKKILSVIDIRSSPMRSIFLTMLNEKMEKKKRPRNQDDDDDY